MSQRAEDAAGTRPRMVRPRESDLAFTHNQRQGLYGEGFVRVIANAAGLLVERPEWDVEGIDLRVGYPGDLGDLRSPRIELQVKTVSTPKGTDAHWSHRLRVKHFNALAGPRHHVPRFLVLVTVPLLGNDYVIASADEALLHHAGYWVSFTGQPRYEDAAGDKRITVQVPRSNLLTPQALIQLMTHRAEPA